MISPEEFIAQWGKDDLLRAARSAVKGLALTSASQDFLVEAGLPQEVGPELTFDFLAQGLPTLPDALAGQYELPPTFNRYRFNRYRLLGRDDILYICLDESTHGTIVVVDAEAKVPTRFMNSSVPQLAECLLVFRDLSAALPESLRRPEAEAAAAALQQQLQRIDPKIFSDIDNWWALIVEQRKHGLM